MEAASFTSACKSTPLSIPSSFILPEEKRPQLSKVSMLTSIPIIDLNDNGSGNGDIDSSILVQKISHACEEYGFFQIINHGIPEELCSRMMDAVTEFFELPLKERRLFYTTDHTKQVKLFNYYLKTDESGQEKVSMWSECFSHPWNVREDMSHLLPENPPEYREVIADYAKEIGTLTNRLLSLISQGLGLEKDCMQKRLGENPALLVQSNHYPPCPEPDLTLGLGVHTDFTAAITVLRQSDGVNGLQVIKDGKWIAVQPIPNAFVINLGDQMQVMSNGRYKSVHHRAVTNKAQRRLSLGIFYGPNEDTVIGPIEELVDKQHPPCYWEYRFAEFSKEFHGQEGTRRRVKEAFELQN